MKSISVKALDRLSRKRRFSLRTLEIAKRLFVDKHTASELAIEYDVNVQRIYAIRRQVAAAAKADTLPAGWEEITIAAPKPLIREMRKRVAKARADVR
jgi:hypothetical protein